VRVYCCCASIFNDVVVASESSNPKNQWNHRLLLLRFLTIIISITPINKHSCRISSRRFRSKKWQKWTSRYLFAYETMYRRGSHRPECTTHADQEYGQRHRREDAAASSASLKKRKEDAAASSASPKKRRGDSVASASFCQGFN
jgi:hypothetical protein